MQRLRHQLIAPALLVLAGGYTALIGAGYSFVGSAPSSGPGVFPTIIGTAMAINGLLLGLHAMRAAEPVRESGDDGQARLMPLVILILAITAFILTFRSLGAPLATIILFLGTSAGFGDHRRLRAATWGLVAGIMLWLVFGLGLGLPVPPGPLLDRIAM